MNGFELALQPQMLKPPLDGRKLQTVSANSMRDLFHMDVPIDYIPRVFDLMKRAHWPLPWAGEVGGRSAWHAPAGREGVQPATRRAVMQKEHR